LADATHHTQKTTTYLEESLFDLTLFCLQQGVGVHEIRNQRVQSALLNTATVGLGHMQLLSMHTDLRDILAHFHHALLDFFEFQLVVVFQVEQHSFHRTVVAQKQFIVIVLAKNPHNVKQQRAHRQCFCFEGHDALEKVHVETQGFPLFALQHVHGQEHAFENLLDLRKCHFDALDTVLQPVGMFHHFEVQFVGLLKIDHEFHARLDVGYAV
jgi:hypothetical protein